MLAKNVKVVEVGPRDGLQNEPQTIALDIKLQLINKLSQAGLKNIEAGSFVSPKWVPQMADSLQIMQHCAQQTDDDTQYSALVPNVQGMQEAISANVKEVGVFTAISETFCQKNINCSIEESLQRYSDVIELAKQHDIRVRGYISCCLGCPYEGEMSAQAVADLATTLFNIGCYEISLGDTVGTGTPRKAQTMIAKVAKQIPVEKLAAHFHDTYGQALANIYAVLEQGVRTIDSSIAGLGGCPYAKGASGNVATEDVVYLLQGLNIETGVDLDKLIEADHYICQALDRTSNSKVALAKS